MMTTGFSRRGTTSPISTAKSPSAAALSRKPAAASVGSDISRPPEVCGSKSGSRASAEAAGAATAAAEIVPVPVAAGRNHPLGNKLRHTADERHGCKLQQQRHPASCRHFTGMPEQPEAGYVSCGIRAALQHQLRPLAIQHGHPAECPQLLQQAEQTPP